MPLIKANATKQIPDWADYSEWGISRMAKGTFLDSHYHDHHEWVLLISGKLETHTEGQTIVMDPGDVLLTKMGDGHDWLAVEDSVSVWVASRLMGAKRPGHLTKES